MTDNQKTDDTDKTDESKTGGHKGSMEVDHKLENLVGGTLDSDSREKLNLDQFATATRSRYDTIKSKLEATLTKLGSDDLTKRNNVITHVGQALNDIYEIERKPRLAASEIEENLASYVSEINTFHDSIINKSLSYDMLHKYIGKFVDLTGPNRDTTNLFLSYEFETADYLMNHTLNTILISLSLAIEVSKLMEQKLTLPEISADLRKVLICNRKIFTRKELVEVGISALLHDMYFKTAFPGLNKNTTFGIKDQGSIEKHPSEIYHFLKQHMPLIDFEIKKSIYQHHEYMDGTGYPAGAEGRLFGRYSPVLSFAVHYVEHTTENPFFPLKHPFITLQTMITRDRNKFDDDVIMAFIKGSGIYPLGSWVLLNTGQIGIVFRSYPDAPKTPVVRVILDKNFAQIEPVDHDTRNTPVKIHSAVPFLEVKKRVPNYRQLLFTSEVSPSPFIRD